jgi:hypothetical protein
MENLEVITDNDLCTVYRYSMVDMKVILFFDKADQQLYMTYNDLAKCLNYKDQTVMLSSDLVLDILSAVKKEIGIFPLKEGLASVSLLRKIPMK